MRLCDIVDIKSAFMEKTDLSEIEIQSIIDDIPTAFDEDTVKSVKTDNTNKKISPLSVISVPMRWDGRDSQLMWVKINEIINYLNKE